MVQTLSIKATIHNPSDIRLVIKSDITDKVYNLFIRCPNTSDAFAHAKEFLNGIEDEMCPGGVAR